MALGTIQVSVNDNKYCTHHHGYAPRMGGVNLKSTDGLRERWVCARCHRSVLSKLGKAFGLSDDFVEALVEEVA